MTYLALKSLNYDHMANKSILLWLKQNISTLGAELLALLALCIGFMEIQVSFRVRDF